MQYPRNTFLENLNVDSAIEILKDRADITNIISSVGATSTLNAIRVVPDPNIYDNKWTDGYPENLGEGDLNSLITGNGDGTVPYESLNYLTGVQSIDIANANHRGIVTRAQKDIIEILAGKRPEDYYSGPWSAIKRVLFIRVYSPVDFQVIAPDGKIIGKDFAANEELNQIEGAFYSGFDSEAEFVTIINPLDGDYKVKLQGMDNGTYKLGIDILEDRIAEQRENLISGIINSGGEEIYDFNYQEDNEIPEIIIEKEINFDDLIKDLDELYNNNEIKKESAFNYLSAKIRKLSKIYDRIEDKKSEKKEKRKEEFIKESDKVVKKLKFYLKKDWITQIGYDVLENNINSLINKIN